MAGEQASKKDRIIIADVDFYANAYDSMLKWKNYGFQFQHLESVFLCRPEIAPCFFNTNVNRKILRDENFFQDEKKSKYDFIPFLKMNSKENFIIKALSRYDYEFDKFEVCEKYATHLHILYNSKIKYYQILFGKILKSKKKFFTLLPTHIFNERSRILEDRFFMFDVKQHGKISFFRFFSSLDLDKTFHYEDGFFLNIEKQTASCEKEWRKYLIRKRFFDDNRYLYFESCISKLIGENYGLTREELEEESLLDKPCTSVY